MDLGTGQATSRPSPRLAEETARMRWFWLQPIGKLPPLVWLLAGALLLAALRFATFDEPIDRDNGYYLSFGHGMHQGKHLYRDLIDHKPPGLFAAYYLAEFLTGYGKAELYLLNVTACVAALIATYAGCALLTANRKAGLAAGALWMAVSGYIPLFANQPNAEAFMNAFTLAGLACLGASYRKPSGWLWIFASGLCFAAASLFKQVSMAVPLLVLSGTVLLPYGKRSRAQALAEAGLGFGVITACWLATLGIFKLNGTYPDFVNWVFDYGKEYAGNMGANLFAAAPFPRHSWILLPGILAGAIGIGAGFWKGDRQPALTLLMLAIGTYVAVALPGKTFPHYYQLWFPFAALGFGFSVHIASKTPSLARYSSWAGFAIPLVLGFWQLPDLALSPAAISVEKYGPQFREARIVGDFLNRTLAQNESFFILGDDPELYFHAGRSPLLPFADCIRLISPTYGARDRAALLGQLQQALPEVIVADVITENYLLHPKSREAASPLAPGQFPPYSRELIEFLETNYRAQIPPLGRFVVMARKGGVWEKRWANAQGQSPQSIMEGCLKAEAARD